MTARIVMQFSQATKISKFVFKPIIYFVDFGEHSDKSAKQSFYCG